MRLREALKSQINALASQSGGTGLEYLNQLVSNPNIQWDKVALAQEKWSYDQAGLTPAGAALLSIAVAAYMPGASGMFGTTTATGTTLGGVALTTTTAAGVTTATFAGAALNAGFTALASQAAVAMVNNKGDIGKTLEQMGKEESIKNLLTTMVTAGALDKLNQSLSYNGVSFSDINAKSTFGSQLLKNVTNNLASSAVDAALNGKAFNEDAISKALSTALVTTGMAQGANAIGDAATGKNGNSAQINAFTQAVAHAVLGCAGGAATAGNASGCAPGAVGGVVGELAAQYYNPSGDPAKTTDTVNFAKTMAAVAGVLVGGGGDNTQAVNIAATTGANAAQNNRQLHPDERRLAAELAARSKGKYTARQIEDAMRNSGNGKGETVTTGMVVSANDPTAIYDKDAQWQKADDGKLVQVLPNDTNVDPALAAFITSSTGGSQSAYSWYNYQLGKTSTLPTSSGAGANKQRYEQIAANGKVYTLPVADCPAVSCTTDSAIARYGVSAEDAATIAAYDAAKIKEMAKDAVTGGLIVVTAVTLPATAIGAATSGAIVGGGSSAANQKIDDKPVDGAVVATETVKGAVLGVAGYGVAKGLGVADDVLSKASTKADDAAVLEAQAIAKARVDANSGRDAENYLPETWTRLKTQTDQLRAVMPDMVKSTGRPAGNAATAEINVYGQGSTTVQAHSQIGNDAASMRDGFVSLPPEGQRILKPLQAPEDPIPRQVDTEYKILESFAQKNIGNTNVQGSINLFTERPPCSSCTNVIEKQFADLFPNMEVRVFHNNGEIAVYKGGVTNTVNMPAQNKAGWPTSPDLPSPLNK